MPLRPASLNLSTYIALYTYGYRNTYERAAMAIAHKILVAAYRTVTRLGRDVRRDANSRRPSTNPRVS